MRRLRHLRPVLPDGRAEYEGQQALPEIRRMLVLWRLLRGLPAPGATHRTPIPDLIRRSKKIHAKIQNLLIFKIGQGSVTAKLDSDAATDDGATLEPLRCSTPSLFVAPLAASPGGTTPSLGIRLPPYAPASHRRRSAPCAAACPPPRPSPIPCQPPP